MKSEARILGFGREEFQEEINLAESVEGRRILAERGRLDWDRREFEREQDDAADLIARHMERQKGLREGRYDYDPSLKAAIEREGRDRSLVLSETWGSDRLSFIISNCVEAIARDEEKVARTERPGREVDRNAPELTRREYDDEAVFLVGCARNGREVEAFAAARAEINRYDAGKLMGDMMRSFMEPFRKPRGCESPEEWAETDTRNKAYFFRGLMESEFGRELLQWILRRQRRGEFLEDRDDVEDEVYGGAVYDN